MHEDVLNNQKFLKEKELYLERNNCFFVELQDEGSDSYKTEVSAIWKNSVFQYLIQKTRNELVAELSNGGDVAALNVARMIKGIDALAIKMQSINRSVESRNQ